MNIIDLINRDRRNAVEAADANANVCFLATVDEQNWPTVRTLTLREIMHRQLIVFVNASSPKWRHLQQQSRSQALMWYPSLQIQYRVSGEARVLVTNSIRENWHKRPTRAKLLDHFYEQRAAQSARFESRALLLESFRDHAERIDTSSLEPTSDAIGVALHIESIERLDLSQNDLPHARTQFHWHDNRWEEETLVP